MLHSVTLKALQHKVFSCKVCGALFEVRDLFLYIAPCNGLQGAVAQYAANQTRNTGANPFSFFDKCTVFFF